MVPLSAAATLERLNRFEKVALSSVADYDQQPSCDHKGGLPRRLESEFQARLVTSMEGVPEEDGIL